jgi:hypothetical protein
MVLRLMPRSPRRRIHLATVISGNGFALPGWAEQNLRRFSISNGCQDHAVLPYAPSAFAKRLRRVWYPSGEALAKTKNSAVVCAPDVRSQAGSLPCNSVCAPALPRPSHTLPNVRDDRDTPLFRAGMAGVVRVIWVRGEAEYFCKADWTGQISLIRLDKLA